MTNLETLLQNLETAIKEGPPGPWTYQDNKTLLLIEIIRVQKEALDDQAYKHQGHHSDVGIVCRKAIAKIEEIAGRK